MTSPPGGVNRTALSTRLNTTWWTRSRSASTIEVVRRTSASKPHIGHGATDRELGEHLVDEGRQGHRLELERHLAALELRQVQQLVDEPARAARSAPSMTCSVSRSGCSTPSSEVLQMRADRGDRRLQLVRDVRHEVAPRPLEELELGAHAVECGRELADLVAAARVDARRVVARLHPANRGRPCRAAAGSSRGRAIARSTARSARQRPRRAGTATTRSAGSRASPTSARACPRDWRGLHRGRPSRRRASGRSRTSIRPTTPQWGTPSVERRRVDREVRALESWSVPRRRAGDDRRIGRDAAELAVRRRPRQGQRVDRLAVPRRVPQGEPDHEVADEQREGHRQHDDRAELGADRPEPFEGPHRHAITP